MNSIAMIKIHQQGQIFHQFRIHNLQEYYKLVLNILYVT